MDSLGRATVSARNVLLDGLALRIGELEALRAPQGGDLYSPTGLGYSGKETTDTRDWRARCRSSGSSADDDQIDLADARA